MNRSLISKQELVSQIKKNPRKPREKKVSLPEPSLNFETVCSAKRIEITLNLKTVSEGNNFDPWRKKHDRHKAQKRAVMFAILPIKSKLKLPCKLTFIRYAPKSLDAQDNLPYSMKWICDAVCAELTDDHRPGKADSNPGITFAYDQVKSKVYAVKVLIEF